jgi:hypothetical protein
MVELSMLLSTNQALLQALPPTKQPTLIAIEKACIEKSLGSSAVTEKQVVHCGATC